MCSCPIVLPYHCSFGASCHFYWITGYFSIIVQFSFASDVTVVEYCASWWKLICDESWIASNIIVISIPLIFTRIITIFFWLVGCCHYIDCLRHIWFNLEVVTPASWATKFCISCNSDFVCIIKSWPLCVEHVCNICLVWSLTYFISVVSSSHKKNPFSLIFKSNCLCIDRVLSPEGVGVAVSPCPFTITPRITQFNNCGRIWKCVRS